MGLDKLDRRRGGGSRWARPASGWRVSTGSTTGWLGPRHGRDWVRPPRGWVRDHGLDCTRPAWSAFGPYPLVELVETISGAGGGSRQARPPGWLRPRVTVVTGFDHRAAGFAITASLHSTGWGTGLDKLDHRMVAEVSTGSTGVGRGSRRARPAGGLRGLDRLDHRVVAGSALDSTDVGLCSCGTVTSGYHQVVAESSAARGSGGAQRQHGRGPTLRASWRVWPAGEAPGRGPSEQVTRRGPSDEKTRLRATAEVARKRGVSFTIEWRRGVIDVWTGRVPTTSRCFLVQGR